MFQFVIIIISFVLVGLFAQKKPLVLNYIIIVCYTLYNPITNKVLFAILAIWFLQLLITKRDFLSNKYILIIFCIGTYWLLAGIWGIAVSTTMGKDDIPSFLLSPYFNGVIWAIIIVKTNQSLLDLKRFCIFYSVMRFIEIGVLGIYIYVFQYDTLIKLQILLKDSIRLDVDPSKRLISLASRNANEAAFLLVGAAGILFYKFYNRMKFVDGFVLLVTLTALVLTWTRSGWLIYIIEIFFFFLFSLRIKKNFLRIFVPSMLLLLPIFFLSIISRASSESRLLSDETITLRFDLYYQYLTSIFHLPFFHGIYEDIWTTCDKLNIYPYISSENIFIDTFVKHGILAGMLYCLIWGIFFYVNLMNIRIGHSLKNLLSIEDARFVYMMAAIFFSLFLMSNTSLFEQTSFFWILFGLSAAINIQLKKIQRLNGEKGFKKMHVLG